ncbi:MAG: TonB-dependent receptor, partial [candidate division Zixibacteria bacterium]
SGQIYNLYAQDEHRLSDKFKVVGGLHFNYYSYTTGRVMPKGALIWSPYRGGTYKAIVSRGFRSPTFYELTFTDGSLYAGNPDLKPELITSYDIITSHEFPYGFFVDVAYNYSEITDLIQQAYIDISDPSHPGGSFPAEVFQFRNSGDQITNSFELGLRRSPVYRLSGFANITYQNLHVCNHEGSETSFNSPKWLGNLGLTYQLMEGKLIASAKVQYVGARAMWDETWMDEAIVTDMYLRSGALFKGVKATVGVKNLFDTKYAVPISPDYAPSVSIDRPGRSLYLNFRTTTNW